MSAEAASAGPAIADEATNEPRPAAEVVSLASHRTEQRKAKAEENLQKRKDLIQDRIALIDAQEEAFRLSGAMPEEIGSLAAEKEALTRTILGIEGVDAVDVRVSHDTPVSPAEHDANMRFLGVSGSLSAIEANKKDIAEIQAAMAGKEGDERVEEEARLTQAQANLRHWEENYRRELQDETKGEESVVDAAQKKEEAPVAPPATLEQFAKFGLSPEDVASIEGIGQLSPAQQTLVLEHMNDLVFADVKAETAAKANTKGNWRSLLKNMVTLGAAKSIDRARIEKELVAAYRGEGDTEAVARAKVQARSFAEALVRGAKEQDVILGPDGKAHVQLLSAEKVFGKGQTRETIGEESWSLYERANEAAEALKRFPVDFENENVHIPAHERRAYERAKMAYSEAREAMLGVMTAGKETEDGSMDMTPYATMNALDAAVSMERSLSMHPDAAGALEEIEDRSALVSGLRSFMTRGGLYIAGGAAARMGIVAATGGFGLPLLAATGVVGAGIGKWQGTREGRIAERDRVLAGREGQEDLREEYEYPSWEKETDADGKTIGRHRVVRTRKLGEWKDATFFTDRIGNLEKKLDDLRASSEYEQYLLAKEWAEKGGEPTLPQDPDLIARVEKRETLLRRKIASTAALAQSRLADGSLNWGGTSLEKDAARRGQTAVNRLDLIQALARGNLVSEVDFVAMQKEMEARVEGRRGKIDAATARRIAKAANKAAALRGGFAIAGASFAGFIQEHGGLGEVTKDVWNGVSEKMDAAMELLKGGATPADLEAISHAPAAQQEEILGVLGTAFKEHPDLASVVESPKKLIDWVSARLTGTLTEDEVTEEIKKAASGALSPSDTGVGEDAFAEAREMVVAHTVGKGETMWGIARELPGIKDLSGPEKDRAIANLFARLSADDARAIGITSGNPTHITPGDEIDLEKLQKILDTQPTGSAGTHAAAATIAPKGAGAGVLHDHVATSSSHGAPHTSAALGHGGEAAPTVPATIEGLVGEMKRRFVFDTFRVEGRSLQWDVVKDRPVTELFAPVEGTPVAQTLQGEDLIRVQGAIAKLRAAAIQKYGPDSPLALPKDGETVGQYFDRQTNQFFGGMNEAQKAALANDFNAHPLSRGARAATLPIEDLSVRVDTPVTPRVLPRAADAITVRPRGLGTVEAARSMAGATARESAVDIVGLSRVAGGLESLRGMPNGADALRRILPTLTSDEIREAGVQSGNWKEVLAPNSAVRLSDLDAVVGRRLSWMRTMPNELPVRNGQGFVSGDFRGAPPLVHTGGPGMEVSPDTPPSVQVTETTRRATENVLSRIFGTPDQFGRPTLPYEGNSNWRFLKDSDASLVMNGFFKGDESHRLLTRYLRELQGAGHWDRLQVDLQPYRGETVQNYILRANDTLVRMGAPIPPPPPVFHSGMPPSGQPLPPQQGIPGMRSGQPFPPHQGVPGVRAYPPRVSSMVEPPEASRPGAVQSVAGELSRVMPNATGVRVLDTISRTRGGSVEEIVQDPRMIQGIVREAAYATTNPNARAVLSVASALGTIFGGRR